MSSEPFHVEQVMWSEAAAALRAIRYDVFVAEQGVPEALEWDGIDPDCAHVLARDSAGAPIGTGRLLPDGYIGRMAVVKAWRRRGVGRAMLAALVALAKSRGDRVVALHAQVYVTAFYEHAGFVVAGGQFMEAGIAHVEMRKDLGLTAKCC
jgi:predicted GNAT family N-acyltransferase